MPTALMFDPRLWLYLAVLLVFFISAFLVLTSSLIVFAVVAVSFSVAVAAKSLHARSKHPGRGRTRTWSALRRSWLLNLIRYDRRNSRAVSTGLTHGCIPVMNWRLSKRHSCHNLLARSGPL